MRRILVNDKNEFKCSSESKSRNMAVKKLGNLYKSMDKKNNSTSEVKISNSIKEAI